MITIAEAYVRVEDTLAESALERSATTLHQVADDLCRSHFTERYELLHIAPVVRIETGSTEAWVAITAATIPALLLYGSIRQSIDYLLKDAETVGRALLSHIRASIGLPTSRVERQELQLRVPGKLHRLFSMVEQGRITPEEATTRALQVVRAQEQVDADIQTIADQLPQLVHALEAAFQEAATRPTTATSDARPRRSRSHGVPSEPTPQIVGRRRPPTQPHEPIARRRRGIVVSVNPRTGAIEVRVY